MATMMKVTMNVVGKDKRDGPFSVLKKQGGANEYLL
jgi:hypothetical protein